MRLELGTFPVKDIAFGERTCWRDGVLELGRDELVQAVLDDRRIVSARIELAKPGESVRIWPVRDVVEPRIKVEGPGVVYPGICGRPIANVGQGVTHRLSGVGVMEVSEVTWHEAGGDHLLLFVDMSGPWAQAVPYGSMFNVCVLADPDPALSIDAKNRAVHQATLTVADALAAAVEGQTPPESQVFDLGCADPSLPNVVYILCIHSNQAKSRSLITFCTSIYGVTQLTPAWAFHPNELLDGAISGPFRTAFATSWMLVNNPVLLEMYRRHGKDLNFRACIATRTEWTTQHEKDLIAQETAKLAWLLGAQGALITWDAGGNEFMEVIRTVQACERLGVKTVFLTGEDASADGVSTMLEPVPEADAMVSSGFNSAVMVLGCDELPPVERVIGAERKLEGRLRDVAAPTRGKLPPPLRYEDHYGFNRFTCTE